LENFCKREEAAHYKGFCKTPGVQNWFFSGTGENIFDRLIT
jgi:hypothetical protein